MAQEGFDTKAHQPSVDRGQLGCSTALLGSPQIPGDGVDLADAAAEEHLGHGLEARGVQVDQVGPRADGRVDHPHADPTLDVQPVLVVVFLLGWFVAVLPVEPWVSDAGSEQEDGPPCDGWSAPASSAGPQCSSVDALVEAPLGGFTSSKVSKTWTSIWLRDWSVEARAT